MPAEPPGQRFSLFVCLSKTQNTRNSSPAAQVSALTARRFWSPSPPRRSTPIMTAVHDFARSGAKDTQGSVNLRCQNCAKIGSPPDQGSSDDQGSSADRHDRGPRLCRVRSKRYRRIDEFEVSKLRQNRVPSSKFRDFVSKFRDFASNFRDFYQNFAKFR